MSYLYSRYLNQERKSGSSCRLPAWNMGKEDDGQIVPEEEMILEEEQIPEENEIPEESQEVRTAKIPIPGWEPEDLPENRMEEEDEQDRAYFRTLYPSCIRRMRDYVEEECDHLDGPGSLIYDEYPDRVRLRLARDRIFDRMREDSVPEAVYQEELARDVAETLLYQEILSRRGAGRNRK